VQAEAADDHARETALVEMRGHALERAREVQEPPPVARIARDLTKLVASLPVT